MWSILQGRRNSARYSQTSLKEVDQSYSQISGQRKQLVSMVQTRKSKGVSGWFGVFMGPSARQAFPSVGKRAATP